MNLHAWIVADVSAAVVSSKVWDGTVWSVVGILQHSMGVQIQQKRGAFVLGVRWCVRVLCTSLGSVRDQANAVSPPA